MSGRLLAPPPGRLLAPPPRWTNTRIVAAGVAALLLPLVVSALRLVAHGDYNPTLDHALTELQVRDVGRHPVLLGPFSREGWSHPGPALFYLLALPYRLVGGHAVGLLIGALLINGAALVGMAVVGWRRGGPPLFLLTVLGSLALVRSLGVGLLADPWNPFVTVLPFGFLLFLTWSMLDGESWALPVAVGVGSFVVQSHIAFAAAAAVLLLLGVAGLSVDLWRRRVDASTDARRRRDLMRAAAATVLVLIAMWTPPVVDQVARSGNLGDILEYFTEPKERHSITTAIRTLGLQFGSTPEWLTGSERVTLLSEVPHEASPELPFLLVGLFAGTGLAWRRRWRAIALLGVVVIAGAAVAVGSVMQVVGPVYFYLVRWTWVFGMAAGILVASVVLRLVGLRAGPPGERWSVGALAAGMAVLAAVLTIEATTVDVPDPEEGPIVAALARQVLSELPRDGRPVLLRGGGGGFQTYPWGLAAALEREGVGVAVDRQHRILFGSHRVRAAGEARIELFVAEGGVIDELADDQGYRPVAHAGTHSAREAARRRERVRELEARHARGDLSNVEYLEAVSALPSVDVDVVVFHRRLTPVGDR